VVYARGVKRKESWLLRLSYAAFYRIPARLSNVELPVDRGDFGLMSRRVVEQLRGAPERHRHLRGLRAWAGFPQIGVTVERTARGGGGERLQSEQADRSGVGRLLLVLGSSAPRGRLRLPFGSLLLAWCTAA